MIAETYQNGPDTPVKAKDQVMADAIEPVLPIFDINLRNDGGASTREKTYPYHIELARLGASATFDEMRQISIKRLNRVDGLLGGDKVLFDSLERGTAKLATEEQVDKYILAYGNKHFLKFKQLFANMPDEVFSGTIDVVDWGCGAGLGIVALADYCRRVLNRDIESQVRRIVLVEPSGVALERASINSRHFFPESDVISIKTDFESLVPDRQLYDAFWCVPRLHIFSNVLDLNVDKSKLYALIKRFYSANDYYLCASPTYNNIAATFVNFSDCVIDTTKTEKRVLRDTFEISFSHEIDGADAKMTGLVVQVRDHEYGAKSQKIKNWPVINAMLLRRDSTLAQQSLAQYVAEHMPSDDWECGFRPNLMGSEPDVVAVNKKAKHPAYLIQACDAQSLQGAEVDHLCRSIDYIERVKAVIFNQCSKELAVNNSHCPDLYRVIKTVIFLSHLDPTESVTDLKRRAWDYKVETIKKAPEFPRQTELNLDDSKHMGRETNNVNIDVIRQCSYKYVDLVSLHMKYTYFKNDGLVTSEIHGSLMCLLKPITMQSTRRIRLAEGTATEYAISSYNVQRKLLGVVGAGKTTILVERALSAFKRTHKQILILCYNISLRNYIEQRLVQQNEGSFSRDHFYVSNYHEFLSQELRRALAQGLPGQFFDYSFNDDKALINLEKYFTRKYEVILIDETQDFKYEWLEIVKKLFLAEGGEYVLFGDEKQNIYDRELGFEEEAKKPRTNVKSGYKKLSKCHRSDGSVIQLLRKYQERLMNGKYELDIWENQINDCSGKTNYFPPKFSIEKQDNEGILEFIHEHYDVPYEEMTVLSTVKKHLQICELSFKKRHQDQDRVAIESMLAPERVDDRAYKLHFNGMASAVKFSTVHSYKGWESNTIVIFIEPDRENTEERSSPLEVLYVGLSRARKNLFIFDFGDNEYGSVLAELCSGGGK